MVGSSPAMTVVGNGKKINLGTRRILVPRSLYGCVTYFFGFSFDVSVVLLCESA
jgi:hypothetical protein